MTVRMGRKLAELVGRGARRSAERRLARPHSRRPARPGTHPASLAATVAAMGIGPADAFAVQQYGVATAILGAALRLMRISFVETQAHPLARDGRGAGRLRARSPTRRSTTWRASRPATDILAALHVKGHVRMFMN